MARNGPQPTRRPQDGLPVAAAAAVVLRVLISESLDSGIGESGGARRRPPGVDQPALAAVFARARPCVSPAGQLLVGAFSLAAFSSAPRLALFATSVRCLNSSSWRIGSNWSSSEGWNFDHCRSARTFSCSALAPYLNRSRAAVLLLVAQVIAPHQRSPGISGDSDHLELPGLLRLGQFQALHALGNRWRRRPACWPPPGR